MQVPTARSALPALPDRAALAGWPGLCLALAAGLVVGWGAAGISPDKLPDASLRLAAVLTLPLPIVLLQWLTTPALFSVRAWLGESGPAALRHGLHETARLGLWAAVAAIAAGAAALGGGLDAAQALRLTTVLATSGCAVLAATAAALLLALRVVASGGNAAWTAVSGGANFGPQETAPLLYAPGFGWIAGLVPAAVLSAVWAARPELLSPAAQLAVLGGAVVLLLRLPAWGLQQVDAVASRALHVAAAAHALPFAVAQLAPPVPGWLGADRSFVALVFGRWNGAPWLPPLGLAAALGLALGADTPGWLVAALAAAAGSWSPLRSLQLQGLQEDDAASWLGATAGQLTAERRSLAQRLAIGALPVLGLGAVGGQWLAAAAGTVLGAAFGIALVALRPRRRAPQLALLLVAALAVVAASAGQSADNGTLQTDPVDAQQQPVERDEAPVP